LKIIRRILLPALLFFFGGCAPRPLPPVKVAETSAPVDYQKEVKPVLDRRCVVCHSCYNSPCQLKLSSFEGLDRGATKTPVYDGSRLEAADPTRLFIDARSTREWHNRHGFYSVTRNTAPEGFNDSTLISLLDAKRREPHSLGSYKPEYDRLTCPKNHDEVEEYLDKHPDRGMPYGFPPLPDKEFDTVARWLQQGARGPDAETDAALKTPSDTARRQIETWEGFLNDPDPKHAMTARYLYEHLFLAHIHFTGTGREFYELVRSYTPPGEPVEIIPTLRPYDDPGKKGMYYRFRRIHSTIVHKTHMLFEMGPEELARIEANFIGTPWTETPHVTDYDAERSANPFASFAQIPPSVRYRFLLDHSEYIIRTFIRGPVCKGQVALNVINDHFWVMFLDPAYDLSLKYPNLLAYHETDLSLPTEVGSDFPAYRALSNLYIDRAIDFYKKREELYALIYTHGLGYEAVWPGEEADDAPLLTVYRHFDSASVHKGALGDLPKTLWVIDYPLFERIYYALVAGFDVYGNIGHQANVRRYMDRLRVEGESYFLDFMPKRERKKLFYRWNRNLSLLVEDKLYYRPSRMPAAVDYATDDPKREFAEHVILKRLNPSVGIGLDEVNYFEADAARPGLPEHYRTRADFIQAFRAVSKPGTAFVKVLNGHNSNLAYVRVRRKDGDDLFFSVVINRWHDNVAFMFNEEDRLDPSKDDADFIFGWVGSYPNFFFDFSEEEAPDFFDLLAHYEDTPYYRMKLLSMGTPRSDGDFWRVYDRFQERFDRDAGLSAGLFDLNRYYYMAFPEDFNGTLDGE